MQEAEANRIWMPVDELDISLFRKHTEKTSSALSLFPGWELLRESLKSAPESRDQLYKLFQREHALETGAVEGLYDISRGVTQTLIAEGFIESLVSQGDANISTRSLFNFLNDQREAIEWVFDMIAEEQPDLELFSIHQIKSLHQLITQSQDYIDAITTDGKPTKKTLIKGDWKTQPNNPYRDGAVFEYCPPEQVQSEMERFVVLAKGYMRDHSLNPIVLAAWVHYAFIIIHPFEDGNGRIARLLTSFVLLKRGLLPFTVRRFSEGRPISKLEYIQALEKADQGDYAALVRFVSDAQRFSLEFALQRPEAQAKEGLKQAASRFATILKEKTASAQESEVQARAHIFELVRSAFNSALQEVASELDGTGVVLQTEFTHWDDTKHYYYSRQIADAAIRHGYFALTQQPRAWVSVEFDFGNRGCFQMIFSMHYVRSRYPTLAMSGFIKQRSFEIGEGDRGEGVIWILDLKPLLFSPTAEADVLKSEFENWMHQAFAEAIDILGEQL